MNRRELLTATMLAPVLLLPGCQTRKELSLTEAIRRLLLLAAQRALAMLMRENGFFDDAVARISLPDAFGGEGASRTLTTLLLSSAVRGRLLEQANRAAEKGAELAAPMIADTVRTMQIDEALAIVSGSPTAATDLLKGRIGSSLLPTMLPGVDQGLRLFDSQVVTDALRLATGIDFTGLRDDVTTKAADGIFRAIGREEAAIRADPAATNDPLLIGVFGLGGRKL